MSLLQTPWTQQPQQSVGIDTGNAFGSKCDFAWLPTATSVSVAKLTGQAGIAADFSARKAAGKSDAVKNRPFTVVLVVAFPTASLSSSTQPIYVGSGNGFRLDAWTTGGGVWAVWTANGVSNGATQVVDSSGVFDSRKVVIVSDWTSTGQTTWCKKDGLPLVSWSDTFGYNSPTDTTINLGDSAGVNAVKIYGCYILRGNVGNSGARNLIENPWQIFKPLPRRIFVPVAAGGLTQVYQSLDATYGMAGSVTADRAASYNVRTTATANLSANYTARTSAVASLSAAYTARTSTTTDLSASYGVAGNVQQNLSSSYNIRASTTVDRAASYSVRGTTATNLVPNYTVRSAITTDLTPSYTVRAAATQDLAPTYSVRTSTTKDLAPNYNLRSAVTQDVSSAYQIVSAGTVGSSITASYNVRATTTTDLAPGYAVRESVSSGINVGFTIAQAVAQSVAADYKVRTTATQSLPATYNILVISQVVSSLTANYLVASELIVRDGVTLGSALHPTAHLSSYVTQQAQLVSPIQQKVNISSTLM